MLYNNFHRVVMLALTLGALIGVIVTPASAEQMEDISVAMKHTKKVTLVAVNNNGDEPVYGIKISSEKGVRYIKLWEWDRERIDRETVFVSTDKRPIDPGSSMIAILIVKDKQAPFRWDALDGNGNFLAGMMISKPPERNPFKPTQLSRDVVLHGAGATFPFPLIDKWRVEYSNVFDQVAINYQSIGSGGGVKQFSIGTVDFGATDAPLKSEQFEALKDPIHIPEALGAVALTYNIPKGDGSQIESGLKMSPDIVADIFLGKISKWDDTRIATLNPDIVFPDENIIVIHRSDGSGTTFVFSDYLSTVSKEWEDIVGKGKAVQWPTGIGTAGNEGVAGIVRSTPYSLGYVELAYATQTGMSAVALQNQEGEFILPSLDSAGRAAGNAAIELPKPWEDWSKVSLVNAPGSDSYPITTFTYFLLYSDLSEIPSMTFEEGQAMVDFIYWAVTDGQRFSSALQYVPLPEEVVQMNIEALKRLHLSGTTFKIPG